MEKYWKQHKVYLYGQLGYFSHTLEGHPLGKDELRHYFPADCTIGALIAELRRYEEKGYFKVKVTLGAEYLKQERAEAMMASRADPLYSDPHDPPDLGSVRPKVVAQSPLSPGDIGYLLKNLPKDKTERYLRFELTDVEVKKIRYELKRYLAEFRNDELTTGTDTKPERFESQQSMLRDAAARHYPQHGYRPIIKATDIWQKQTDLDTFWELIFAHVDTHAVKLLNMGYDDKVHKLAPGLTTRHVGTVPFSEIEILDEDFRRASSGQQESAPIAAQAATGHEARAFLDGRLVNILANGETYTIARLGEGSSNYLFMRHLTSPDNADIDITISEINSIKGCAAIKTLTELVRHCGFDKELKKAFFPICKEKRVRFRITASLNAKQLKALKSQAAKIVSKS